MKQEAEKQFEESSLLKLLDILRQYILIIFSIIMLFSLGAYFYSVNAQKIYQTQVILVSNSEESSGSSQLGGLAQSLGGLVGLSAVSDAERKTNIAIAKLNSKRFMRSYLSDTGLIKEIFSQNIDPNTNEWKEGMIPSIEQVKNETDKRFKISKNKLTGLITLTVEYPNQRIAFEWADGVIDRINEDIRKEDSLEGERSIAFLQSQLRETSLQNIKSVFFALIEQQTQKIMLANIRKDYAFKVIDPAIYPESHTKPNKSQVLLIGLILGSLFGVLIALFLNFLKEEKAQR